MITLQFYKYQGTGNDFVMIDDRSDKYSSQSPDAFSKNKVAQLCHRRFGIGADGLILLQDSPQYDFKMMYYNSDGAESTMCGNGGRCIVAFAKYLGIIQDFCVFEAIDGLHKAYIDDDNVVSLKMNNVDQIFAQGDASVLDTGSPHYVLEVKDVDALNVKQEGSKIRYSEVFEEEGINVNFIEPTENNKLRVRTYERGVEDETYSCGTGVTASAIAYAPVSEKAQKIKIETLGGNLEVAFTKPNESSAKEVFLIGPTAFVFSGLIDF